MNEELKKLLRRFRITIDDPEIPLNEEMGSAVFCSSRGHYVKQTDIETFEEIFEPLDWKIWYDDDEDSLVITGVLTRPETEEAE